MQRNGVMGSTCCAPFPIGRLFDVEIKRVDVLLKINKTIQGRDHIETKGTTHDQIEMVMIEVVKLGNNHIIANESGTMINKIQGIRVFENVNCDFSYRKG